MFGILGVKKGDIVKDKEAEEFLFGFIASAAAPILGEVAKPLLKEIFGGRRARRRR